MTSTTVGFVGGPLDGEVHAVPGQPPAPTFRVTIHDPEPEPLSWGGDICVRPVSSRHGTYTLRWHPTRGWLYVFEDAAPRWEAIDAQGMVVATAVEDECGHADFPIIREAARITQLRRTDPVTGAVRSHQTDLWWQAAADLCVDNRADNPASASCWQCEPCDVMWEGTQFCWSCGETGRPAVASDHDIYDAWRGGDVRGDAPF